MAITPPPKKKNEASQNNELTIIENEKKINEFINKGGSPASKEAVPEDKEKLKSINIKLLAEEIDSIKLLRGKRPRHSRSGQKRLAISLHDWIVEAIQEKIEREQKKFDVKP